MLIENEEVRIVMVGIYASSAITTHTYDELVLSGRAVSNESSNFYQHTGSGTSDAVIVLGSDFVYSGDRPISGTPTVVIGLDSGYSAYQAFLYNEKVENYTGLSHNAQVLKLFSGNDIIQANQYRANADFLRGFGGNDTLDGSLGNDRIKGDAGNDKIIGGLGRDGLTGGLGADTFIFKTTSDSTVATGGRDRIIDFRHNQHDQIDLRAIDANTSVGGDQAFHFIGDNAFSHDAGELHVEFSGANTVLSGDVSGDGRADFAITLNGHVTFEAGDFLL